MAKLPDGWVFIPKAKKLVIEIEEKELVMCRNCRHGQIVNEGISEEEFVLCLKDCDSYSRDMNWFCADGERRDNDA